MTEALINHLWQSTVFLLAAAALTLAFATERAQVRFAIWMTASVKFLIPFAPLIALGGQLHWRTAPAVAAAQPLPAAVGEFFQPGAMLIMDSVSTRAAAPLHAQIHWGSWALLAAYLAGLLIVIYLRARDYLSLREIALTSLPLDIPAPIPVRQTAAALEPALSGLFSPTLLLPARITEHLTQEQLRAVLAHELAHWRRRDNLTATVHMAVEALVWFHPLVWWLGTRLVTERERACDEAVIESGNERKTYAESILKVCRLYVEPSLSCTPAISGGSLRQRIEDIMTSPIALTLPRVKRGLLALVTLAVIATPMGLGVLGAAPALSQTASNIPPGQAGPPSSGPDLDLPLYEGYVGTYQFIYLIGRVVRNGTHLFYNGAELFPMNRTEFFCPKYSATYTFTTDAQGHATALTYQGKDGVATAPRVDEATAQAFESAQQTHIQSQTPYPGSEAALRKLYASMQAGTPDLGNVSPVIVAGMRRFTPRLESAAQQLGSIQSMEFRGVGPQGQDVYDANYENDTWTWAIAMTPDNMIKYLRGTQGPVQSRAPLPGSEASIRKYWASLLAGEPNYEDMSPLLANTVREQLPQLLAEAQRLGALQSLQFRGVGKADEDVYDAHFNSGILTWWVNMGPDGKVKNRAHRPGPAIGF